MRIRQPVILAKIAMMSLWCTFPAAGETDRRLVVAADEWCPYNCMPGSERPGYLIEVLQSVYGKLGITVEYRVMR